MADDRMAKLAWAVDCLESRMDAADPCWRGYEQRGMKEKGGDTVPNCVKADAYPYPSGPGFLHDLEDTTPIVPNCVKADAYPYPSGPGFLHDLEDTTPIVYRAQGTCAGVPVIVNVMADSEAVALNVARTVHNLDNASVTLIGS